VPIPVAVCTLESPVPVPLRTVLCFTCVVLNEPQSRYRTAQIQTFLPYYITYTAGEIVRYFKRCA